MRNHKNLAACIQALEIIDHVQWDMGKTWLKKQVSCLATTQGYAVKGNKDKAAERLAHKIVHNVLSECEPALLPQSGINTNYRAEGSSVRFYNQTSSNEDVLTSAVQTLVDYFGLPPVNIEYAMHGANALRLPLGLRAASIIGETFGGGAILIEKGKPPVSMTTFGWLREQESMRDIRENAS